MKAILILAAIIFTGLFAAAGGTGGAVTVGDGGFGVICPKGAHDTTVQLLDLFEAEALGRPSVPFFAGKRLKDKVRVAVERVRQRLGLSAEQTHELAYAAERFMRFPYDPWQKGTASNYSYFLRGEWPTVRVKVYEEMQRRGCRLETIVVRPTDEEPGRDVYRSICSQNVAGFEYCFLTNSSLYRKMDNDARACLILHEALRFLPGVHFHDEENMRVFAASICAVP